MKNKICFGFFLMLFFTMTGCGLEDILYFEAPTNFRYSTDEDCIEFTGYNQEKEDTGKYCFVGYDIYYYFTSDSNKRRAQVYLPYPYLNTSMENNSGVENTNMQLLPWASFYNGRENFYGNITETYRYKIYQYITLPVTLSMIENVLYEGNSSNLKVYFDNKYGKTNFSNPSAPTTEYIRFLELFPNIDDYPDEYDEYEAQGKKEFLGFRDARFYKKMGINPVSGTDNQYRCYFYAVAKGFDSATKTSFVSFSESSKSSTILITFTVDAETME